MARKLTEKEFITELAKRWGVEYDSAKIKYYEMINFLCDELLMYGFIDLPTFGSFRTKFQQGKYAYIPADFKSGEPEKVWIDPYFRIKFKATKTLKDYINKDKVTKAETLRLVREIKKQKSLDVEKEKQIQIAQNREDIMAAVQARKKERAERIKNPPPKPKKKNGGKAQTEEQELYSYWDKFTE